MSTAKQKMGQLKVIQSGPHSLLQDLGRKGTQHLGFCQSGAVDEHSFLWANKLLGNNMHRPCLEISFGPFECEFTETTTISITGAAQTILFNNAPINGWQSLHVNPGDRLQIKAPKYGLRSYIAIKNGFHFESLLNSASMTPRENSGPFDGKCFSRGQTLDYSILPQCSNALTKITPAQFIPNYDGIKHLNIFVHTDSDCIEASQVEAFFETEYTVGPNSNRMAYCLEGEKLPQGKNASILSTGTPFGTIQIPPSGQPIILLKDRQTIGGYPSLGCVTHLDCFILSQMRPGQQVRFTPLDIENGQKKLKSFYSFFS